MNTRPPTTRQRAGASRRLVTVVMPAYNEEENLPELFDRVRAVADEVRECDFEFLLIDNCSQDRTETLARKFVAEDRRWRYLRFSRNFGFETSLVAGLHYARGDALIFLPSDMQDPPEAIPTMVAKWREGYDVVYGQLARRRDDSLLKTLGARIAYKLIYHLSDVKIPENASDFRLISRPVIEALKRCGERNRYLRGLVHWVGFRQHGFSYERAPRNRGRSKAGLGYCFGFAVTALVTFSAKPLRWASILGLFAMAASVVGAFVYTLLYALHRFQMGPGMPLPGWTTIVLLILFFGGVQCLFLGILGEYLGNVHIEVKRRPLWVVDRTAGFPAGMGPPRSSDRAGVLHGRTHEWEGQTLAFHERPAGTIDGPDTEIPETRDSSPVHA